MKELKHKYFSLAQILNLHQGVMTTELMSYWQLA